MSFSAQRSLNFFAEMIATFFFVGRVPKAPGTAGSLAALPLAWFLWQAPTAIAWAITGAVFALGVWAAGRVIRQTGVQDHQSIVIDEVVGIFVTASVATQVWWQYALVFAFFRLFDIWKPGPIRILDRQLKGGLGTMADDLVAALMAAATLYFTLLLSANMLMPAGA